MLKKQPIENQQWNKKKKYFYFKTNNSNRSAEDRNHTSKYQINVLFFQPFLLKIVYRF